MRSTRNSLLAPVVALAVSACTPDTGGGGSARPDPCRDPGAAGCALTGDTPRVQHPNVSDADLRELVAGNSAFAVDLYQELRGQPGNLFCAPSSISEALAMTYAGARGDTAEAMASTLHFTLPEDRLHPAFDALDLALASRGKGAKAADGTPFRLTVANALWGQQGYTFRAPFLDTLAASYGAGVNLVDFKKDPETSRTTINDWVSDRTEGRIEDLLPRGSIGPKTRLVLTNAVYFNAAWAVPFAEQSTAPAAFTRRDGSTVTADTMSGEMGGQYAEGPGFRAIELPYDGNEVSMVLILPTPGTIDAFEASFTPDRLDAILKGLAPEHLEVRLPKFRFESMFSLKDQLAKMGMGVAFDDDHADFSGMTDEDRLVISDVVHKTFVGVDEKGTEAAAATAVIMNVATAVITPEVIDFDHPFLFLVRDDATGAIVFLGRVDDPTA